MARLRSHFPSECGMPFGLDIEAPQRIDDPDRYPWHASADLVVIGLGGAGYYPLRDAALAGGLVFHRFAEARQLAIDRSGRVIGVKALQIPAESPHAARF